MAKPILIVRADVLSFTSEQLDKLKICMRNIETDYHVLMMSIGAPKGNISFEVLNGLQNNLPEFSNLTTTITGKDLLIAAEKFGRRGGDESKPDHEPTN